MLLLCSKTLLPPQYLLTQLQTHTESLFQKGLYWCVQNQCLLFLVLFSIESGDLLFPKHGQCIFPPFAHAGPSIRMLHIPLHLLMQAISSLIPSFICPCYLAVAAHTFQPCLSQSLLHPLPVRRVRGTEVCFFSPLYFLYQDMMPCCLGKVLLKQECTLSRSPQESSSCPLT